jgi:hypothetical protein
LQAVRLAQTVEKMASGFGCRRLSLAVQAADRPTPSLAATVAMAHRAAAAAAAGLEQRAAREARAATDLR